MIKKFFDWLEGEASRGRKVVLFSTIFVYLIITLGLFGTAIFYEKFDVSKLKDIYLILTGLMASIYGFYTGTSSEKSSKLADKAAQIMIDKLDELKK